LTPIAIKDVLSALSSVERGKVVFTEYLFPRLDLDNMLIPEVRNRIEFIKCEFPEEVDVWDLEFKQSLVFKECTFSQNVYLSAMQVGNRMDFTNCTFHKNLHFDDCTIDHGVIHDCHIFGVLSITGGKSTKPIFIGGYDIANPTQINRLQLRCHDGSLLKLDIRNLKLKNFSANGVLKEGEIVVDGLDVLNVSLFNFENCSKFNLYNIKSERQIDSTWSISKSNLGDARLYHIDFESYEKMSIKDSYLVDCKFISVNWKFPIHSDGMNTETTITNEDIRLHFLRQIEVYRQLKHAMSKSGNYIEEKRFYSQEMNCYNKTLSWKTNFWNKLILSFSNYCSNYGQSFLRPLLWLFLSTLIFFGVLVAFYDYKDLQIHLTDQFNRRETYRILGEFFNLLNPARKFEDLTGFAVLIDLISRVLASAFIYNMIRATRRFVG
jgi:hypothetical protein